jgi:aspartate carbamoyltransferase regulatory subunit
MTKTITFLFVAVFILSLTSCFDIECINRPEVKVNAYFYDYDTKKQTPPDSVSLHGIDNPAKIHDKQSNLRAALLPLKASENETGFIIKINGITDTIRFVHSNSLQLISKECGYLTNHKIDTLYFTTNKIDSISLTNREITAKNIENVAIFY